jgi:Uma2 family endonuclease
MATVTKQIDADEFFALGDIGRAELIDGEIVHRSPSGAEHGNVALNIAVLLREFVKQQKLGRVFAAETGFKLAPMRVRAPDVAFVSGARLASGIPSTFFDGPPDLAVEVVSPSDTWPEVTEKVEDWLAHGTRSCWVIDPKARVVMVYHAGGHVTRFSMGDSLEDAVTFPGFKACVADFFEG